MSSQDIPIIDIAALRENRPEELSYVAEQLHLACKNIGFFYITNHKINDEIIKNVFKVSEEFFALPFDEKMNVSMEQHSHCFRGYSPVLTELADGKRNSYELMEFSVDHSPEHPNVIQGKPMHGPNLWPDIPGYRRAITQYINAMIELGFDLMSGIALGLNLPDDYFYNAFNGSSFWQFRTTHYPQPDQVHKFLELYEGPSAVSGYEIGDYSCGAHTDYGCLTILLANNPGLQVQRRDGVWINAPAIPGTFICNIGDMLSYWTKELYVATRHRVLTKTSRISLPFFFQPDYETIIQPIDTGTESEREFLPFKYGPYAFEKYKGIYPNSPHNLAN